MPGVFQVVAECAHATVNTAYGRMWVLLDKGALVPADAPELPRLLDIGYVVQIGGETGGVDAEGVPAGARLTEVPPGVTSTPVEMSAEAKADAEKAQADAEQAAAEAEADAAREAARVKLAEIGGVPDGRSSDAVFVEYLAANGYEYDELVKADRNTLKDLVAQVKSR